MRRGRAAPAPGRSGKQARRAADELAQLRNDLAHGQAFVSASGERIVRFSERLDQLLE